jgi:hypothetical protein
LNNFKTLTNTDINNSNGIYFLNAKPSSSNNLNKLLDLKILNYFVNTNKRPLFCFEHNNSISTNVPKKFLLNQSCYNYINLPNNVFFEDNLLQLHSKMNLGY